MTRIPLFLLLALALCLPLWADDIQPLAPDDYYDFQFIQDPQLAGDGGRIAFVRAQVNEERRGRDSAIWTVAADGSSPAESFTSGDSDRHPRFSPGGSELAFLRPIDGDTQIHRMPIDGGEARPATTIRQGRIAGFTWLPDGQRMVLTLSIDPAVDDPTEAEEDNDEPSADVKIYSRQLYRTEAAGWLDERRNTLWLLELESGELTRLTADSEWNYNNPAVSPDGRLLAFNADRSGSEYDGGHNQDIYLLDLDSGEDRKLPTPDGRATSPVFSPDGQQIAFSYQSDRYRPTELHLISIDGEAHEVLHDGQDLSVAEAMWPEGYDRPLIRADYRGSHPLMRLHDDGSTEILIGEGAVLNGLSFADDGRTLAFLMESETRLAEVHLAGNDSFEPRRLTEFNDELLSSRHLGELDRFSFEVEDNKVVDGFLLRPKGFEADQPWSLVLNIRGGPAGMWGHRWFHEFQMMAGAGYAVLFTNYRGSTGYGFDFQSAVYQDYGGVDYRDNIQALDEALQRFDWIDVDRLYLTGGSHGGFLTNWITTQTDRFRAAVTQRSVSNWVSEAGTQAYVPAMMNAEFGGTIWENYDYYWGRSPLKYADQVRTPTLIIHSTDDQITPIGQGQEWFYALINNDVETELAVFEGEGHGLSRAGTPVNLVKRLELILDWFERHHPRE
ncbi:S9 family peptidase [Wenzhouxiangella sp. AB-CW3]|uniref:S9 family peptidase n=1 Tax=Wenzhouxiangella sp. AB-CW3 TaxID=2771012 RepID=UPI00168BDB9C|nr:S9 family peptidase [Wenzhouxiangella sp. AB-CW3]QOC23153.1 S9 family peptidase [Wenzhouxiangella sp. AB-CW3]